jgi:hypothetical protein
MWVDVVALARSVRSVLDATNERDELARSIDFEYVNDVRRIAAELRQEMPQLGVGSVVMAAVERGTRCGGGGRTPTW